MHLHFDEIFEKTMGICAIDQNMNWYFEKTQLQEGMKNASSKTINLSGELAFVLSSMFSWKPNQLITNCCNLDYWVSNTNLFVASFDSRFEH